MDQSETLENVPDYMSCDDSCSVATNLQISIPELNFLALDHLKQQGLDVTNLIYQLKHQGRLKEPQITLPTWHKEQNHNFLHDTHDHSQNTNNTLTTYNYLPSTEKTPKKSRDLPNLLNQLVRVTREHFPSLHVPENVSVFDQILLDPYPLCPRKSFGQQMPMKLIDANSRFGRRSQIASIAHVVVNRECGNPISTAFKRLPSLHTNYERLITIEGHYSPAYCCTFDKSGKRLFTASDDRTIKVWSVYNGVLLYCLRGHEGEIVDISVDPFNRYLASASNDAANQIRVWALNESYGINIKVLRGNYSTITVVAFNPSTGKKQLLGCDFTGKVSIWNSDDWNAEPIVYHCPEQPEITTAVWNHNGTKFATAGESIISIWTVEQGLLLTFPAPDTGTFTIRTLQWCPYYNGLAAGAHDGSIQFWYCDSPQWQMLENWQSTEITPRVATRVWSDRIEGICMLQFTADGNYLVSSQVIDSIISVWCTRTKEKLYEYAVHRNHIFTLLPHPVNPRLMITAGYDGLVTILDVVLGKVIRAFMINVQVADGSFSSSGDNFAFTSLEGTVTLFGTGSQVTNFCETPTSQFFASEVNALMFDSVNNIAMDAVLHVPSCRVPREIGDRSGRVYEDLPSIFLGPVPYEPEPPLCEIETQCRYVRRIEGAHCEIPDDGTKAQNVEILFPIIEPPSPVPDVPEPEDADPSSEEELADDDDDDWEGSSRVIQDVAGAHTLQTRRRTYAAQESESDSESEGSLTDRYESRPRRATTSQRKYPAWVTTVRPIHNAYIPQVNDEVIYFVEGHEQYMETYRERGSLIPSEEPFVRCRVESVDYDPINYRKYRTKVRFQLRLRVLSDDPENDEGEIFTICYHPLSKCPDFLILASLFDHCSQKNYYNKRYRMFYPGNEIYYGRVVDVGTQFSRFTDSPWESLQVEWEHNQLDNDNHVSCWEVELLPNQNDEFPPALRASPLIEDSDDNKLEEEEQDVNMDPDSGEDNGSDGGNGECGHDHMEIDSKTSSELESLSPVNSPNSSDFIESIEPQERRITRSLRSRDAELPHEPEIIEARSPEEWLRQDEKIAPEREAELAAVVRKMFEYDATLEFRFPIDLSILPNYYTLVLCAIDLSTIIQRLENRFYRREEAIVDDLMLLEHNALVFNGANSWFYKVSNVIRTTLGNFIERNEWEEPDFNIPEELPEESESEMALDENDETPEENDEILEDDIDPPDSPLHSLSPYPLRRASRSSRPGLRRSARERSSIRSFSEQSSDEDEDEAFPRPKNINSRPSRNYNTRHRSQSQSSAQVERSSDEDEDEDETAPVPSPPRRGHQRAVSVDTTVFLTRRPRLVTTLLNEEICNGDLFEDDDLETSKHPYPTRSRRSEPKVQNIEELSDEEFAIETENQEDFVPETKPKKKAVYNRKATLKRKQKARASNRKQKPRYDSTPEESPDESVYESSEETKYEEPEQDHFEEPTEDNSGLRRSGRKRAPPRQISDTTLEKRSRNHPSAPSLATRRAKRACTKVNYNDFDGYEEEV